MGVVTLVKGDGGDVFVDTPEAVPFHQVGFSVVPGAGVVEVHAGFVGAFGPDILGDLVDVAHELIGVVEGVGVDFLHEVGLDDGHTGAVVADVVDLEGAVDVAV